MKLLVATRNKKKLGELKRALALLAGESSKEGGKKKERILLKTPKVCRAAAGLVMLRRTQAYQETLVRRVPVTMAPRRCTAASTSSAS